MLQLIAVRPLREVRISDMEETDLYDQIDIDVDRKLVSFYRCDCSKLDRFMSDCEHLHSDSVEDILELDELD